MWALAVLFCVAATLLQSSAHKLEYDGHWETFKATRGRSYSEQEEPMRRAIFEDNMDYINEHNDQARDGVFSYTLKAGPHCDKTEEEMMNLLKITMREGFQGQAPPNGTYTAPSDVELPDYVDWVKEGIVTRVKDMEDCAGSWAFTAIANLECCNALKTGSLVSLSEQNLIDCATFEGNNGCDGGSVEAAFQYSILNKGIDTEQSYPFENHEGVCRYRADSVGASMNNYMVLPNGDEDSMKSAVALVGPISAILQAKRSFIHYGGGIYHEDDCSGIMVNHAVLIVGYGYEDGQDYWMIKNCWGDDWGEKGYMKIARGENMCGIATEACFPMI